MPWFLDNATPRDKLTGLLQYAVGHQYFAQGLHWLSQFPMGGVTPKLTQFLASRHGIDLAEAEESDLANYATLQEFYTRTLQPDARPLDETPVISPVDGTVRAIGNIDHDRLIQSGEHAFGLEDFFGGLKQFSRLFQDGAYCVISLGARDYHRVHAPVHGRPKDMLYLPGRLFCVNDHTLRAVPNLLTRNERVIGIYKTDAGPMALAMINAYPVFRVETTWDGPIEPSRQQETWEVPDNTPVFAKGEEIGVLNQGSAILLLFTAGQIQWLPEIEVGQGIQMGRALARMAKAA